VLFSRSLDGGASFTSPVILSTSDTGARCPALGGGSGGRVYVTWSEGSFSSETFVAKLRTSWNGGSSFGPPQTVPVVGSADGCPETVVDQANRLHLAWPETPAEATWADVFHSVGTPPPPIRIWRAQHDRPQPHALPTPSRAHGTVDVEPGDGPAVVALASSRAW
jgi:hypothetical protein